MWDLKAGCVRGEQSMKCTFGSGLGSLLNRYIQDTFRSALKAQSTDNIQICIGSIVKGYIQICIRSIVKGYIHICRKHSQPMKLLPCLMHTALYFKTTLSLQTLQIDSGMQQELLSDSFLRDTGLPVSCWLKTSQWSGQIILGIVLKSTSFSFCALRNSVKDLLHSLALLLEKFYTYNLFLVPACLWI